MANPTTNYGWPMPTSSDLVTDLPADFDAFGQPVDNTLKALNPETTLGDIAYRSAVSNTNTRLGIGSAGQVLTVASGVPSWATPTDEIPLTTKGDLLTFDTADAVIGVGADDTVLTADSSEATGMKWAAPAGGSTFEGCSIYNSTDFSITNATFVTLTFDSEFFDVGGYHTGSSGNIVIPSGKAGKYLFTAHLQYASNPTGERNVWLLYNGARDGTYSSQWRTFGSSANNAALVISHIVDAAVGDTFGLDVYQSSGGSLTIDSNSGSGDQYFAFQCTYLGV